MQVNIITTTRSVVVKMDTILLMIVFVSLASALLLQASPENITVTMEPASITSQVHCKGSAVCINDRDESDTFLLTPFWSSTGLCPSEPRNKSGLFLLSRDSLMNLEIIAALTDRAVRHVRIHWMLQLLNVSLEDGHFQYNFTELDMFLDYLKIFGLHPAFELMGVPLGEMGMATKPSNGFWKDLVLQLVGHYSRRFGLEYVAGWRFETWNEPDLKSYNMLNFSVDEYLGYVNAIRQGLDATGVGVFTNKYADKKYRFNLHGPAGLFKAEEHHPFCWGIIEHCNAVPNRCPIDTITFHRKGSGRWASEVVDGGRQLVVDIFGRFPNIRQLKLANDEADPIASWSTGRPFQADVRYAAMLFSIVAQHWDAMANPADRFGQRFLFLSHDNAFLAYHPYEFEQRTLLARFQMNETEPPHVQFVTKPVYSALGMLAMLGPRASRTRFREGNVSYIVSFDERSPPAYLCLLASRSNDSSPLSNRRSQFNVSIPLDMFWNRSLTEDSTSSVGARVSFLIEAIQDGLNDPFRVWQWQGRPPYPSTRQLAAMRAVQFAAVLNRGGTAETIQIGDDRKELELSLSLRGPWIVSVRICSNATNPGSVRRVRVRTVFNNDVLIFWAPPKSGNVRCIQTYEVWFKPRLSSIEGGKCHWRKINTHQHTPFTFFQYAVDASDGGREPARGSDVNATDTETFHYIPECSGVYGYYKVRAIDMFNQAAPFSSVARYAKNRNVY